MQVTRDDAIIKRDVNIRSTFFTFGGDVNYRSQWQYWSSSSFACFRSIPYLVFKLKISSGFYKLSLYPTFVLGYSLDLVQGLCWHGAPYANTQIHQWSCCLLMLCAWKTARSGADVATSTSTVHWVSKATTVALSPWTPSIGTPLRVYRWVNE